MKRWWETLTEYKCRCLREGADWRYWLTYASDQAAYAAANDRVGVGVASSWLPTIVVRPDGVETKAAFAGTAGVRIAGAVAGIAPRLATWGPWGVAAAAVLGIGAGLAYLYYRLDAGSLGGAGISASSVADDPERDAQPTPGISPSAGTGTPDPEDEPGPNRKPERSPGRGRELAEAADRELPHGMSRAEFGRIVGFRNLPQVLRGTSTEATPETITAMRSRGITRNAVDAVRRIYAEELLRDRTQAVALHRFQLLSNIIEVY